MVVTTGGWFAPDGANRFKRPLRTAVAPPEVTATSVGPAFGTGGVVAEMSVGPSTLTLVAGRPPTVTVASAANPLPVIEIDVPPVVLPTCGEMPVIDSLAGDGVVGLLVAHDPNSDPASRREPQRIQ